MIFNAKSNNEAMRSFSFPFVSLSDVRFFYYFSPKLKQFFEDMIYYYISFNRLESNNLYSVLIISKVKSAHKKMETGSVKLNSNWLSNQVVRSNLDKRC